MNIEEKNAVTNAYRDLINDITPEYTFLYEDFENDNLRKIFSTLHYLLTRSYSTMNQLLPTQGYQEHFWAEDSRDLLKIIDIVDSLRGKLINSEFSFKLDDYYKELLIKSKGFLSKSGGSLIPENTDKITLYYEMPIFLHNNSIKKTGNNKVNFSLKPIGRGSYADVFKYTDTFYEKEFVVKRAKKTLDSKEIKRFEIEFEQMKKLNSPYVTEVYTYDKEKTEYIMEYMDYSLASYLTKFQSKDFTFRKRIANQILNAFRYIHSKDILHRDISHKNILIKAYEDVVVVKVSDFGLVKIPESGLTSLDTEIKGAFNDPSLLQDGFANYDIRHEIYALTKIIYYTFTNRTNIEKNKISNESLKRFVDKGLNKNKDLRYKNVDEMINALKNVNENI